MEQNKIQGKLTLKQKSVLDILENGGQIVIDDMDQDASLSDIDGNVFSIQHRTIRKLMDANLIKIGHPPALNFTRIIFNPHSR